MQSLEVVKLNTGSAAIQTLHLTNCNLNKGGGIYCFEGHGCHKIVWDYSRSGRAVVGGRLCANQEAQPALGGRLKPHPHNSPLLPPPQKPQRTLGVWCRHSLPYFGEQINLIVIREWWRKLLKKSPRGKTSSLPVLPLRRAPISNTWEEEPSLEVRPHHLGRAQGQPAALPPSSSPTTGTDALN